MQSAKSNWGTRLLMLLLVAVLSLGVTSTAYAAEFREGDVVIIAAGEVIDDDLILSAQRVEVYGTITGDAILFGQTVIMDGVVEGSLVVGAQVIQIGGEVQGSTYLGGQTAAIGASAVVMRNLYFGGLSIDLQSGASVNRSAYIAGYQAALDGTISDDAYVGLGSLSVAGAIGGNVYGTVSVNADEDDTWPTYMPGMMPMQDPGINISDDAQIGGEVLVELEEVVTDVDIQPEAVRYIPERAARSFTANLVRQRIGDFIGLLLVGLLFLGVFPETIRRLRVSVEEKPAQSLGWGLLVIVLFFVLLPAVIGLLILAVILGGVVSFGTLVPEILGLGSATLFLIGAVFTFVMSVLSKIVVSYLVGRLILVRLDQAVEGFWAKVGALALGLLLYEMLRAIPFGLGFIVGMLMTWIGVGAVYFLIREMLSRKSTTEELVEA